MFLRRRAKPTESRDPDLRSEPSRLRGRQRAALRAVCAAKVTDRPRIFGNSKKFGLFQPLRAIVRHLTSLLSGLVDKGPGQSRL